MIANASLDDALFFIDTDDAINKYLHSYLQIQQHSYLTMTQ